MIGLSITASLFKIEHSKPMTCCERRGEDTDTNNTSPNDLYAYLAPAHATSFSPVEFHLLAIRMRSINSHITNGYLLYISKGQEVKKKIVVFVRRTIEMSDPQHFNRY